MADNPYRALPSVDELLHRFADEPGGPVAGPLHRLFDEALQAARERIATGERPTRAEIVDEVGRRVADLSRPKLRSIINATGVLIHTNLGRAPVSEETARALAAAAASYLPLELDPETNERGGRMAEIAYAMRLLTGAAATLVVNNNAAAVLLTLSALAAGRSVIVSRGEAVEIGGGFRIPDVLAQSGARLVEVGTTNRTYLRDYEAAVGDDTAVFLKVHTSNFTINGFVARTSVEQLAGLSTRTGIPVIEDLGSGALLQPAAFGLASEPTIGEQIAAGAALVTASGDKLLGGPQAGIIAGRADYVRAIERHPLARAVRADKTCLAGIAATLRHYLRGEAIERIPVWRMIAVSPEDLRARAVAIQRSLAEDGIALEVTESRATIGGGALPGQELPSVAIALPPSRPADRIARALRMREPGVFGRIDGDRVLLDMRTVQPIEDPVLIEAIRAVIGGERG